MGTSSIPESRSSYSTWNGELYDKSPFQVEYELRDSGIEDVPIFVNFKNQLTCRVSYTKGNNQVARDIPVGTWVDFKEMRLRIHTSNFESISSQQSRVKK